MWAWCEHMIESEKMTAEIFAAETSWLSELSGEGLAESRDKLVELLHQRSTDEKLRATLYRVLLRESFVDPVFIEFARSSLESQESTLVTAVVEYLAANDQEWFLHNIGKFIKIHSLSVKTSAIRSLQKISPEAAVSAIRAMVSSRNSVTLHNAINCMRLLPFETVRHIALEIAQTCNHTEVLSAILLLFQNNPEPENIFALYCLEMKMPRKDLVAAVRQTRKLLQTILVERQMISDMPEEQREKQLKSLWRAFERKNCAATSKNKALKSISPVADSIKLVEKPYLLLAIFALIIFVFFLYSVSGSAPSLHERAGPIVNNPIYVEGELVQAEPDYAIVRSDEGHVFHLRPQNGLFIADEMRGIKVTAKLVPYRRTEEGEYRAVCTELRKKR